MGPLQYNTFLSHIKTKEEERDLEFNDIQRVLDEMKIKLSNRLKKLDKLSPKPEKERLLRRKSKLLEESKDLSKTIREIKTKHSCNICYVNKLDTILFPCGHLCLCQECSKKITDNCPICRVNVTGTLKCDLKASMFEPEFSNYSDEDEDNERSSNKSANSDSFNIASDDGSMEEDSESIPNSNADEQHF